MQRNLSKSPSPPPTTKIYIYIHLPNAPGLEEHERQHKHRAKHNRSPSPHHSPAPPSLIENGVDSLPQRPPQLAPDHYLRAKMLGVACAMDDSRLDAHLLWCLSLLLVHLGGPRSRSFRKGPTCWFRESYNNLFSRSTNGLLNLFHYFHFTQLLNIILATKYTRRFCSIKIM